MTAIAFDHSYARLSDSFFARVTPAKVPSPRLIGLNRPLAEQLGLDAEWLASAEGVAMLSGNVLPVTATPIAMAYAGHQFGGWSPQLGDGRAVLIGELVANDGVRRDLQLKGAGRTPFSRQGDGKSPLGPVIREYVVSEAMAALGVPTTRALAAVATGELVHRERPVPGGVFARVAQSHVRVGTFQFFQGRGETERLRELADYVIDRHYSEARRATHVYQALLDCVIRRQAELICRWMQVGFIHGVMNTDNMQIVGETIDFGPCAFMEDFDPATVFSSIDHRGRYAWGNQPGIGQWNLTRFAETLLPLLADGEEEAIELAQASLDLYGSQFNDLFVAGFGRKLGIEASAFRDSAAALEFVNECFDVMKQGKVDFTLFFRRLTQVAAGENADSFLSLFADPSAGVTWLELWRALHAQGGSSAGGRAQAMGRVNPIFIPRNHRVEEAIQAGLHADYSKFETLNAILARPFDEQPEHADYERPAAPDEQVNQTFCGT